MDKIIVIGGGGHAKVLISVLQKADWNITGYTDIKGDEAVLDVPRLGSDAVLENLIYKHSRYNAVIGIGKIDLSNRRLVLQDRFEGLGFHFPVIISPDSVVNRDVLMGAGTVVFDGAVINSGTSTGRACIMNTNCTVEHDCILGNNVHIAPGAILCGGSTIGDNCMIGAGAVVIQKVHISAGCLIGAGAVVVGSLSEPGTYVGNPAYRI